MIKRVVPVKTAFVYRRDQSANPPIRQSAGRRGTLERGLFALSVVMQKGRSPTTAKAVSAGWLTSSVAATIVVSEATRSKWNACHCDLYTYHCPVYRQWVYVYVNASAWRTRRPCATAWGVNVSYLVVRANLPHSLIRYKSGFSDVKGAHGATSFLGCMFGYREIIHVFQPGVASCSGRSHSSPVPQHPVAV